MNYRITCQHEFAGVPHRLRVNDYWPLSREEVRQHLIAAHMFSEQNNVQKFSDIQCRFSQAVPGAKCPHEIEGPTARKQAQMDALFVHTADFEVTDELVNLFCWLMATPRPLEAL